MVPSEVDTTPTGGGGRLIAAYRRARSSQTLRRDSDVMGLTVCIALLVALSAGSDSAPHSKLDVLAVVWGTTIGLALTHWFAMIVSSRLVSTSESRVHPLDALISQTIMALVVALIATAAVLLMSTTVDRLGARLVAAVFMGALVAFETRRSRLPGWQVAMWSLGVTAAGIAVAVTKWYIS